MDKKDLKEAGLKITQPRMRILELLENSEQRHFSAESIYQILMEDSPGIGLATVYRVLTQFEAAGLVERHQFESGQSVFELNRGEHHDHIVDVKSGNIIEFHDEIIEVLQREIAKEHGFELVDHSLIMYCKPLEQE